MFIVHTVKCFVLTQGTVLQRMAGEVEALCIVWTTNINEKPHQEANIVEQHNPLG